MSCSLSEAFVDSAVISSYEFSSLLMFPFDCSSVVKCIIGSIVGTLSDFCSTGGVFSMKGHAMLFENMTV